MGAIAEKDTSWMWTQDTQTALPSGLFRIAYCLPEHKCLHQVMGGEFTDPATITPGYVAAGLEARGHSLTFVAPSGLEETVCASDPRHLSVVPRTWSRSRWFDTASKVLWRVQRLLGIPYLNVFSNCRRLDACLRCLPGHDLVHERNALYNAGVAMACRQVRLPYVIFFDADQIAEYDFMGKPITGLLRWRAKRLLRYNLDVANCIICVSEAARRRLIATWNVPKEKIVVFRNAVDVQRFRPDLGARNEVRTSLGIDENPLIIFVGNFFAWHDVTALLEALPTVLGSYPHARLVLVGDGEERQKMMQYAAELGIGHAVQFTGLVAQTEVPRLLSAADVAVAPVPPMKHDLWLSPLKLFEYMASGKAVVASKVGQLAEVIQDGHNGLLVPPGDPAALAAALKKLIDDSVLRARLGQQAREDAVQKHSWEHYLLRLERVYAAVIAERPVNLI